MKHASWIQGINDSQWYMNWVRKKILPKLWPLLTASKTFVTEFCEFSLSYSGENQIYVRKFTELVSLQVMWVMLFHIMK